VQHVFLSVFSKRAYHVMNDVYKKSKFFGLQETKVLLILIVTFWHRKDFWISIFVKKNIFSNYEILHRL